MNNLRYWLWFVIAFYPGNERIWQMISPFQDVKKAYEAVCNGTHNSLSSSERKRALSTHIEQCDSIIEYCKENGYSIITFEDNTYPPLLRNIYNPPAVLFCMGNIENFLEHPAIACVGTRNPSRYSVDVAEKICTELAKRNFAVVSGFALGIDSSAHRSVLQQNGCTVAVLASGIDVAYPKTNNDFKKIIAVNGAVISEFLPGTHPTQQCFHVRNRIISGLCFGTLVIEASEHSGSLITANHALEQGRTVFCIPPGDIFDKRYFGVMDYLRDGAVPVFNHLDILYDYYRSGEFRETGSIIKWPEIYGSDDIPYRDSRTVKKKRTSKNKEESKGKSSAAAEKQPMQCEVLFDDMDATQQRIVLSLKDKARHPDEICQLTELDSFSIMSAMTGLEIMGAVTLLPDHKYKLL